MARNLHSFTLTDDASMEVQRMKKGSRSAQVSSAICKYANDYKLSPDGVKHWEKISEFYRNDRNLWAKKYDELVSKQGVKHHLEELWKCLSPFPRRKQV
jgi:hypothetical protein